MRLRDAGGGLPIMLAEDLLELELALEEKQALLEATKRDDDCAFEHFLTSNLLHWPQDLAVTAVRLWGEHSQNLLWFRLHETLASPHLPQRVLYMIVDIASRAGGALTVKRAAEVATLEQMSAAFHGLILHRACQWGLAEPRLVKLAQGALRTLRTHMHPDNKALPSALAYAARFSPDDVRDVVADASVEGPWRDAARAYGREVESAEASCAKVAKILAKPAKTRAATVAKLSAAWPALWARHEMPEDVVHGALKTVFATVGGESAAEAQANLAAAGGLFAGLPETTLFGAIGRLEDDATYGAALGRLLGFMSWPAGEALTTQVKSRLTASQDPGALLGRLPLRLRLELTGGKQGTDYAPLKAEEAAMLAGATTIPRAVYLEAPAAGDDRELAAARRRFFDLAYRAPATGGDAPKLAPTDKARPTAPPKGGEAAKSDALGFFGQLESAWRDPAEPRLGPLAQAARQMDGIHRLCYIDTLGRFKGQDQAALKLLDFTRSKEEDELRAVIRALGGIGTPRAAQELVSALTRPNITPPLQLDACQVLARQDLANLQNELRAALKDLATDEGQEGLGSEVREAISSLITPVARGKDDAGRAGRGTPAAAAPSGGAQVAMPTDQQLDQLLAGRIPGYRELSSEVKRALRTSQFFHLQVGGEAAPESIDLSPVIDMQYKALELLFREVYEEPCSRVIQRGILQRRLDVLGYARPIVPAMDEFEGFVASLPIVREIPFFSKFKLRKMLRAICQFRPGKRFTLDGLKAFALFFLCFSRQECRYGLAHMFPIGLEGDRELFEFVKALHTFQDFRNRAAHEGFHPDAANDIDGIWYTTAQIVQTMLKTLKTVEARDVSEYAPKNRSTPVIERKVS
jgi:hypothetical protein